MLVYTFNEYLDCWTWSSKTEDFASPFELFCFREQSRDQVYSTEERYQSDIGIVATARQVRKFTAIMKDENCDDLQTTSEIRDV